jgi:hypothetical protein
MRGHGQNQLKISAPHPMTETCRLIPLLAALISLFYLMAVFKVESADHLLWVCRKIFILEQLRGQRHHRQRHHGQRHHGQRHHEQRHYGQRHHRLLRCRGAIIGRQALAKTAAPSYRRLRQWTGCWLIVII